MLLKVLRPKLIDYINLSKVLDNYTRRCKYTSGEWRVGLVCGWTNSLLLLLSFYFLVQRLMLQNVKKDTQFMIEYYCIVIIKSR